jgi:hypothetical protein
VCIYSIEDGVWNIRGKPSFEELALLLVEAGDPEALQIYLNTKMQVRFR